MKLTFLLLLIPNCLFSQLSNAPHGSLIVAIICNDGILISADTRGSWTAYNDIAKKELPYAYYDGNKKIFPFGNYLLGITGQTNVGNDFWWNIIEKYNKAYKKKNAVDDMETCFKNFRYYISEKLKIPDTLSRGNVFILAGYEKGKPTIIGVDSFNSTVFLRVQKTKFRIATNDCIKPKLILDDSMYYCDNIVKVLKTGYKECSYNWELGIDSNINVIKIDSSNSKKELVSQKFIRFKDLNDFSSKIINGEVKVSHFFPETEKPFIDMLRKSIKAKNKLGKTPTN